MQTWEQYPDAAKRFGWQAAQHGGRKGLNVQTFDGAGLPVRIKFRGPREGGDVYTRWLGQRGDLQGLAGDVRDLDSVDASRVACILTGSETDALAMSDAADRERLPVRIFCSCGETRPIASVVAGPWFRGLKWVVVGDNDKTGRESVPKRAHELKEHSGPISVAITFPPHGKDAREFIESGGKLFDLLDEAKPPGRQPERQPQPTRYSTSVETDTKGNAYVLAVLRGELDRLASTSEGGRERTLIGAAFNIGRKCLHTISFDDAHHQLVAVATSIGLPYREANSKARRALLAGEQKADPQ